MINDRRETRPFETWEVVYLINEAGFKSLETLAAETGRDEAQIENVLSALGIPATLIAPELLICPECGCARTHLNASGRCRVCQLNANIIKENGRIADLLKSIPSEERAGFDIGESKRGMQKNMPPLPMRAKVSKEANGKEKRLADTAYQVAMEEWQTIKAQRAYDASRQRLKDVRRKIKKLDLPEQANGTNVEHVAVI